jgi:hypothetical protein
MSTSFASSLLWIKDSVGEVEDPFVRKSLDCRGSLISTCKCICVTTCMMSATETSKSTVWSGTSRTSIFLAYMCLMDQGTLEMLMRAVDPARQIGHRMSWMRKCRARALGLKTWPHGRCIVFASTSGLAHPSATSVAQLHSSSQGHPEGRSSIATRCVGSCIIPHSRCEEIENLHSTLCVLSRLYKFCIHSRGSGVLLMRRIFEFFPAGKPPLLQAPRTSGVLSCVSCATTGSFVLQMTLSNMSRGCLITICSCVAHVALTAGLVNTSTGQARDRRTV